MKLKNLSSVILAAMMAATSVPYAGLVPYSNLNAYAVEAESEESEELNVVAKGTCGENLTWTIYDFEKLLVIRGEGVMTNWESFDATPWAEYSDYIYAVRVENGVANIGENAFSALNNEYLDNGCLSTFDIENPDCIIADSPYVFPESVTIGGIAGSTAQAYAEKYGKEFVDINAPGYGEQAVLAEGKCGENLTWKIYDDEKCLIISGEGAMDSWESSDSTPWAEYNSFIEAVRLEKGVANIGENAFSALNNDYLDIVIIENPDCIIPDSETAIPDGMTVGGEIGSTAQAYAEKYNRTFSEISTPGNGEQGIMPGGKCGEAINWSFDENIGYLWLSGEGVMNNWESAGLVPWAEYADKITNVSVDGNIESIGDCAFSGLTKLTDVQLEGMANQITRIGAHAFDGCTSLSSTIFVYAEEIQDYAFYGCNSLESIEFISEECTVADSPNVFPEGITIQGRCDGLKAYAEKYGIKYEDCRVLATGKMGDNINWSLLHNGYLRIEGEGDMVNGDGANPWGEYADLIKLVYIDEKVTSIGDYAFYNCENLEDITMAVNAENSFRIGSSAFEGCNSLKFFSAPEHITEIEKNAFKGCETLEFVYIYNADCIISDNPLVFPENTGIYGHFDSTAHSYALKYDRNFLPLESSPELEQEVIAQGTLFEKFPYKLTSMGEFIVEGKGNLEDLTRWSIAFENSEKVTSVTLSEDITAIGAYNFFNCKNLGSMYIGKNVESIGDYAFYGCYGAYFVTIDNPDCVIADSPYVFPKNTVISGYEGSTAEAYAKKYNREFYAIPVEVAKGTLSEDISWKLNSDGGLYIEGNGIMPDYDGANPWGEYADAIEYYQFMGDIDNIGDYTFYNCKNLLNAGATGVIGSHAFDGCEKLEYVFIDEDAVKIEDYAFNGCDSLEAVQISSDKCVIADSSNVFPENVTLIGASDNVKNYAEKYNLNYEDCSVAAEGRLNDNSTWKITNNGYFELIVEGDMLDYDGANPWGEYADKIENAYFTLSNGTLGDYAFYNCKNLEDVSYGCYLGVNMKIGAHAFDGCKKLQYFTAHTEVSEIEDYAFNGCDSLECVNIFNPKCIIADSEFVFPENTVIFGYAGSTAEAYAKKYNRTFEVFGEVEEQLIGEGKLTETIEYTLTEDGVLTISGEGELLDATNDNIGGFWGSLASKIKTIELSGDITEIGDYMFAECRSLENVNIPVANKLAVVGAHAFENCKTLKSFPFINVLTVQDYAFNGCDSLENVTITDPECEIADSEFTFPEQTVITALAGSKAEAYAEKYDRTFETALEIIFGDVNGDEAVDSSDASLVLGEYAAVQTGKAVSFTENQKKAADVNKDGEVSASDASAILAYYAAAATGKNPSWD